MEFLKALFGDKPMTYEELAAKMTENKMNVVNLADGGYVSQAKFDDRTREMTQQVNTLQGQLTKRDSDFANLQQTLTAAQADAGKIPTLQQSMAELQSRYDADKQTFAKQIAEQQRAFAIRERANTLRFSSKAANSEFIREAEGNQEVKLDGSSLLGYEDFLTKYKAENADSFVPDEPSAPPESTPTIPQIVLPKDNGGNNEPNGFHFTFNGVRPREEK